VGELFSSLPSPDKDIVWLADELIRIAQHTGSLSLESSNSIEASGLQCKSLTLGQPELVISGAGPRRVFRPLLARLAVVGSEETGTEFAPNGGCYSLIRSSRSGPVRLDIEFKNSPAEQRLTILRTLSHTFRAGRSTPDGSPMVVAPDVNATTPL
jgi:hypothetical protein